MFDYKNVSTYYSKFRKIKIIIFFRNYRVLDPDEIDPDGGQYCEFVWINIMNIGI